MMRNALRRLGTLGLRCARDRLAMLPIIALVLTLRGLLAGTAQRDCLGS